LALFDQNLFEISPLKGADLDVAARVDLANVLLRADDVLDDRTGHQNLVFLMMLRLLQMLLRLMAS
jgi:hypothetical protein